MPAAQSAPQVWPAATATVLILRAPLTIAAPARTAAAATHAVAGYALTFRLTALTVGSASTSARSRRLAATEASVRDSSITTGRVWSGTTRCRPGRSPTIRQNSHVSRAIMSATTAMGIALVPAGAPPTRAETAGVGRPGARVAQVASGPMGIRMTQLETGTDIEIDYFHWEDFRS